MRIIYNRTDCHVTVECEPGDPAPPEGWQLVEQIDGKKSWYCNNCAPEMEKP